MESYLSLLVRKEELDAANGVQFLFALNFIEKTKQDSIRTESFSSLLERSPKKGRSPNLRANGVQLWIKKIF